MQFRITTLLLLVGINGVNRFINSGLIIYIRRRIYSAFLFFEYPLLATDVITTTY